MSLDFQLFKSVIKTIILLLNEAYNTSRMKSRHLSKIITNKLYRKQATGSQYTSHLSNHKHSRSSLHRALQDINDVFDFHQCHFNGNINLRDHWRSYDLHNNSDAFLSNQHLARKWKIMTRSRDKRILKKFKNNADRITRMTFNAHRKNLSIRTIESVRQTVCYNMLLL